MSKSLFHHALRSHTLRTDPVRAMPVTTRTTIGGSAPDAQQGASSIGQFFGSDPYSFSDSVTSCSQRPDLLILESLLHFGLQIDFTRRELTPSRVTLASQSHTRPGARAGK